MRLIHLTEPLICTAHQTLLVLLLKSNENYPDVKMEDVLGNAVEYGDFSVKVRVYAIHILMLFNLAV